MPGAPRFLSTRFNAVSRFCLSQIISHSPALDFPSPRTGDRSALWSDPTGFTGFACPAGPLSGEVCLPRSSLELLKVLAPLDVRAFPAVEAPPVLRPLLTPAASGWPLDQGYPKARRQVSRGRPNRLRHTPAGFTVASLGGYGLRCPLPTRPDALASLSSFCPSGRGFAPRFL